MKKIILLVIVFMGLSLISLNAYANISYVEIGHPRNGEILTSNEVAISYKYQGDVQECLYELNGKEYKIEDECNGNLKLNLENGEYELTIVLKNGEQNSKASVKFIVKNETEVIIISPAEIPLLRPDLTATITNNLNGENVLEGNTFKWTIRVENIGEETATFSANKIILKDQLYNTGTTGIIPYIISEPITSGGVTGTILCNVFGPSIHRDLICKSPNLTDDLGIVTMPANSYFDIEITVSSSLASILTNPRDSGICVVDPDDSVSENDELNNNCSPNSVTVVAPPAPAPIPPVSNGGGSSSGSSSRQVVAPLTEISGCDTRTTGFSIVTGQSCATNIPHNDGKVLGAEKFNFTLLLKYGARNDEVTELHKVLIAGGYLKVPAPTGFFGPLTLKAVKEYQIANGLVGDGIVGPLTREALNK